MTSPHFASPRDRTRRGESGAPADSTATSTSIWVRLAGSATVPAATSAGRSPKRSSPACAAQSRPSASKCGPTTWEEERRLLAAPDRGRLSLLQLGPRPSHDGLVESDERLGDPEE